MLHNLRLSRQVEHWFAVMTLRMKIVLNDLNYNHTPNVCEALGSKGLCLYFIFFYFFLKTILHVRG